MVGGADGFDGIVVEKVGGLGFFGPIKVKVGLRAEATSGGGGGLERILE